MPKIVKATVTPILIGDPPLLNVLGVHQPYTPRAIVRLETEDGATGVGETYGDSEYAEVANALAGAVVGRPVTALNGLHDLAYQSAALTVDAGKELDPAGLRGRRTNEKLIRSVVSAFEVASLDALGRTLGLPVHALLGGKVRDRVEYSGYLFYRWAEHPVPDAPVDDWGAALDPDGVVRQARRFAQDHGFRSFKLKGGVFEPDREIEAIQALAKAFPDHPLRLDPNGGWSAGTGARVARELDGLLEYLEDPTTGIDGMAEVHRRTGVLLATNMCVTTFATPATATGRGRPRTSSPNRTGSWTGRWRSATNRASGSSWTTTRWPRCTSAGSGSACATATTSRDGQGGARLDPTIPSSLVASPCWRINEDSIN